MKPQTETKETRKNEFAVNELFLNRWSPRAMSGEAISREELMSLFEAARWAPSSFNNQPWRFVYAFRETPSWNLLFDLLVEGNKAWVKNAGALLVVLSKKTFEHNGKLAITHSFDAGAAWENLALQGSLHNLVIHGMQGFDYDAAREKLHVPKDYNVEAMVAIGKPGKKEELPSALAEKEVPSGRKKVSEIAFEGKFPNSKP